MFIRNIVVNIVQNNPRIVGVILRTKILIQNHLIEDIADCTGIGKVWPLPEVLCYLQKTSKGVVVDLIPFLFQKGHGNLSKLLAGIIRKVQHKWNSGSKARVSRQKFFHFFPISGKNNAKPAAAVLHFLQKDGDRFCAVIYRAAGTKQTVGFVDEQHAIHIPEKRKLPKL